MTNDDVVIPSMAEEMTMAEQEQHDREI